MLLELDMKHLDEREKLISLCDSAMSSQLPTGQQELKLAELRVQREQVKEAAAFDADEQDEILQVSRYLP